MTPVGFFATIGVAGYGIGKVGEKLAKTINVFSKYSNIEYEINTKSKFDKKIYNVGDKFKIIDETKSSILIEILNDKDNPYWVDKDFISEISNYKI